MAGTVLTPTSFLPPLAHLSNYSLELISSALFSLRSLYFPQKLTLPKRHLTNRIHDSSVPDSGYASAEEDEDNELEVEVGEVPAVARGEGGEDYDLDILRYDHFEREFTVKWLIGFTARSDIWLAAASLDSTDNEDARVNMVDNAASLLSAFAGGLDLESSLVRSFSFSCNGNRDPLKVELNDAPLLSTDHTSVGLQSWASSVVLAERLCSNPSDFSLDPDCSGARILELGAGTGMLSIIVSKLLPHSTIVATDYHPDVLSNLVSNVDANASSSSPSPISVHTLDWSDPPSMHPFDTPFDIVLAADVIYHPLHAQWIKSCIEKYLAHDTNSFCWLIIPLRSTGRHEGTGNTVEQLFRAGENSSQQTQLAVLDQQEIARKEGIGRADEGSYVLFKIGWS